MKKLLIIAAVLAAMALVFVGCGGDDDSGETPPPGPTGPKTVVLGDFDWEGGQPDNQKGWSSDGTDGKETGLAIEDLLGAKYLVLELNAAPTGGFQMAYQFEADSWGWHQAQILSNNGEPIEGFGATITESDGKAIFKIELSEAFHENDLWTLSQTSTKAKILISYYTGGIAGLGLQKAYLEMPE
jgi:hypothetical protein